MKTRHTAFLLLFSSLFIIGCNQVPDKQEFQTFTNNTGFWGHRFSVAKDVPYGEYPDQKLDVYSQGTWIGEPYYWSQDTTHHPTLIYFHGGGWMGGSKEGIVPFIIPYLQKGWNVVCPNYRTGEGTAPQAVEDAMCAIEWVADNSHRFGFDPQQIVISGESAGGHLALITGMLTASGDFTNCKAGNKIKVAAIINWFGISDIAAVEEYLRNYKPEWNYALSWVGNPARMDSISAAFSPVKRISPATPPIVSIHGDLDSVVPHQQSVYLHQLLQKSGIKNELVSIPGGKHLGFTDAQFQDIYRRIFGFLEGEGE
jgi:acetyl esterase/lipase